jgi:hypothetical protein
MTDEHLDLSNLPPQDVSPERGERIRRRAQAALTRERELADRPTLAAFSRFYSSRLEPALVVTASVVYLSWAISQTLQASGF